MTDDEQFRRALYQAVAETETLLEPGDPRVVPLHQQRYGGDATEVNHDPVADLATTIRWSTTNTTMQLFSGFRGSGKTTELLRLRENLRADGYVVLYVRLEEYLNLKEPVELADFLLATLAATDDAAHGVSGDPNDPAPPPIPYDPSGEGMRRWWDRVKSLLAAGSDQMEVTAKLGPVELKTEFRENPSFRQQVTAASRLSLGAMKREADAFTTDLVRRLGAGTSGLVLLVDSLDHADNRSEFDALMTSIQRLFERHATLLSMTGVHVIYTVPPYLRFIRTGCGPVRMLTTVKVAERDGQPVPAGVEALVELVDRRKADWVRLLGDQDTLERFVLLSGGHLRDLLGMIGSLVMQATTLPASPAVVEYTINQYRNSLVADLAEEEMAWLRVVAGSHETGLATTDGRSSFANLLDRHLVLGYLNGEEWYDVHPLARPAIGLDERFPPPP